MHVRHFSLVIIDLHLSFHTQQQLVVLVGDVCREFEATLQQHIKHKQHALHIQPGNHNSQAKKSCIQKAFSVADSFEKFVRIINYVDSGNLLSCCNIFTVCKFESVYCTADQNNIAGDRFYVPYSSQKTSNYVTVMRCHCCPTDPEYRELNENTRVNCDPSG